MKSLLWNKKSKLGVQVFKNWMVFICLQETEHEKLGARKREKKERNEGSEERRSYNRPTISFALLLKWALKNQKHIFYRLTTKPNTNNNTWPVGKKTTREINQLITVRSRRRRRRRSWFEWMSSHSRRCVEWMGPEWRGMGIGNREDLFFLLKLSFWCRLLLLLMK